MLGSTVVDVAIGVVLTFLGVSLATSAITEAISSVLKWREATLLKGIQALVSCEATALDLYNHALVNPLSPVIVDDVKKLRNKPAYIDGRDFAVALYGILVKNSVAGDAKDGGEAGAPGGEDAEGAPAQPGGGTDDHLPKLITRIGDPQLRGAMAALWQAVDGDVARFKGEIARWFDRAMDRLSGWYKQRTQLVSFIVALLIAVCLNANVLYEGAQIWTRPGVLAGIETGALDKIGDTLPKACDFTAVPDDPKQKPCFDMRGAIDQLKAANLIGWGTGPTPTDSRSFLMALLSWLIVAGSTLFGASFWFDVLQRITQLRGTGLVAKRTNGQTSKPDIAGPR